MVAACQFPSLRGSQVLIREVADQLAAEGAAVHLITYPSAQHVGALGRYRVHRAPRLPGLGTTHPRSWSKLVLDALLLARLIRVARGKRIDLIHGHNIEGGVIGACAAAWLRLPLIYHAHNAMYDELPSYFRRPLAKALARRAGRWLDRRILRRCDAAVALSERLAAYCAAQGAAGRTFVRTPPVRALAVPATPRRMENMTVAYAGNLDPYQDLSTLRDAFNEVRHRLPAARLRIITHRPSHGAVAEHIEELRRQPGIDLVVARTHAAAARLLAAAAVVVCPRGSWSGFPIKTLNYMALGLPIIHARASAHVIEHGISGWIVRNEDPSDMAAAIVHLLRHPEIARRIGENARRAYVEAVRRTSQSGQLDDVYECAVARRRSSARKSELEIIDGCHQDR